MASLRHSRPRPASLRRRFAAGAIDGSVGLGVFVVYIAGLVVSRRRWDWPPDEDRLREIGSDPRLARGLRFVSYGIAAFMLTRPEWRGPGYRIVGLRRVDADTGEVPGLRRRLALAVLDEAVRRVISRLNRPVRRRADAGRAETEARRAEIRTRFPEDPAARARAESELSEESSKACCLAAAPALALTSVVPLTALASPHRQTVVERIAGIVVVRV